MNRPFVVISGLPGSGKSTLARPLSDALTLPLIDKDEILDGLFERRGVGDAAWRRMLSRESDAIVEAEARASNGAVLVSFWRLDGMPTDSGTPIHWLPTLSDRIVNVHCVCEAEIATERFLRRKRHPGHLDSLRSHAEILASLRSLEARGSLSVGQRVEVDTSRALRLDDVVRTVRDAFESC